MRTCHLNMIPDHRMWIAAVWLLAAARPCLLPAQDVPIGGFLPLVGIGLTDEFAGPFDPNNIFFAAPSDAPGGTMLGAGGTPYYDIALLDTGAAVTLITTEADQNFDIDGPYPGESEGFRGANTQTLGGATGFLEALISDPLGLYAGGLQGRMPDVEPLVMDHDYLEGQTNSSILTIPPESDLPNVLGLTFASQYATYIRNDQPLIFQHEGRTVRTPAIDFLPRGSGGQGIIRRAEMNLRPVASFQSPPFFFPGFDIGGNFEFHEDPFIPTVIQGGLFLSVDVENDGNFLNNAEFFFDTGADVTVVSETTALELGYDVLLDEPDFSVAVIGSGGVNLEVPGFFVEEFTLQAVGGSITATNVPIVVLNVPDPSGTTSNVTGIVGTNLLAGRNVVIDPEPQLGGGTIGPQLYIGDPVTTEHHWNTAAPSAAWEQETSWDVGVPNNLGIAHVEAISDGDQEAVLSESTTVWAVNVAGTADTTMTLEIGEEVQLTTFSGVNIEQGGAVNLVDAALDAQYVEILGGTLSGQGIIATGTGHIPGQVESRQGVVSPGVGVGTLEILGRFASGVDNRLVIELAGTQPGQEHDQILVEGDVAIGGVNDLGDVPVGGTLDVSLVDIGEGEFVPAIGDRFEILTATGFVLGQFESLLLPPSYQWQVDYLEDGIALEILAIAGDYNRSGIVDAADYNVWRDSIGSTVNLVADGNANGVIDAPDYNIWRDNFGNLLGAAGAVPEPNAALLLAAALLMLALGHRERLVC